MPYSLGWEQACSFSYNIVHSALDFGTALIVLGVRIDVQLQSPTQFIVQEKSQLYSLLFLLEVLILCSWSPMLWLF
jgi:hypothetical protein